MPTINVPIIVPMPNVHNKNGTITIPHNAPLIESVTKYPISEKTGINPNHQYFFMITAVLTNKTICHTIAALLNVKRISAPSARIFCAYRFRCSLLA